MQALFEKYENDGLRIAAFPCNQFAAQEPWSEIEIKKFVTEKFGITFDMYSKIDVNGSNVDPLWRFIKGQMGGTMGSFVKWNFTKFLIDKQGQPIKRYGPHTDPNNIEPDIIKALKA